MLINQLESARRAQAAGSLGVLLIDDSKLFQRVLQRIVETEGGTVLGYAETGSQGAEMALKLRPAVIILDHNMPDMNGVQCLRAVREGGCSSRVIVCSGELTLENSQEYARLQASAIFVKPLVMPAFIKSLRGSLGLDQA